MSINVLWCDDYVRLDPLEGAALDGEGQAPQAPPVRLRSGQNQYVSFQLLVGPLKGGETVSLSPGRLSGPGGASLGRTEFDVYVEWYHRLADGGYYPDALVPQKLVGGSTGALRKDTGLKRASFAGFWVDLFVPVEAEPGDYAGGVTVKCGRESVPVPVELRVLASTIGQESALDVSMNNYADAISGGWPELRDDPRHASSAGYLRVERGVFRAAHEHRAFIHYMPYGHSGYVHEGFAPPLAGEGPGKRVVSWGAWDRHFGPYFDGSAFRGTRRGAMPIRRFYLPLNLDWPADFVKFGQPGYEAEWRAVGGEIVEHFREKRWTGTRFDMFLNHKQRFRYFPWDCEEVRFLPDNEVHRYFRKLWEGTYDRESTLPVKFDYTLGTTWTYGRDIRSDLAEFIDVFIAGTGGPAMYSEHLPRLHQAGRQIWSCTHSGDISVSTRAAAFPPLMIWMRHLQGYMPRWASIIWGEDPWHDVPASGATTFLYPGAKFGTEETYPSLRLKVQRNALQMVEELELAARNLGREAVEARVNEVLRLKPEAWLMRLPAYMKEKEPKDWTGADFATEEPPAAGWNRISPAAWRELRALSAGLASRR